MNNNILFGMPSTRQISATNNGKKSERTLEKVQAHKFVEAMADAEKAQNTTARAEAKPVPISPSGRTRTMARITPISRTPSQMSGGMPAKAQQTLHMMNSQLLNTLDLLSQSSSPTDSTLETLRNIVNTRSTLLALSGQFSPELGISGRGSVRGTVTPPNKTSKKPAAPAEVTGTLSAHFESGEDISVIGYDSHGGTSYGKYQLSSRAGTMDQFIKYLRKQKPDWAKRLQAAGEADTGGKTGRMPRIWKQLASENPELFESLQDRFVHDNHYKPALQALIRNTGLDPKEMSPALQEVLFSTAVQHGPGGAARIFSKAMNRTEQKTTAENDEPVGQTLFEKSLIENIYALRSRQFGSSSNRVRSAVQSRLQEEKALALAMLSGDTSLIA